MKYSRKRTSHRRRSSRMRGGSGADGRSKTSDTTSASTSKTTQKVDLGDLVEYKNPDGTAALVLTPDNAAAATTDSTASQSGGRRKHRHTKNCRHSRKTHRRSKRGGMGLGEAILPFGLFGLQKLFQKRSSSKAKKH